MKIIKSQSQWYNIWLKIWYYTQFEKKNHFKKIWKKLTNTNVISKDENLNPKSKSIRLPLKCVKHALKYWWKF